MALPLFLAWHKHRLTTHPYLLNSAQSAVLMTVGDTVAQALEQNGRASRGEKDTGYDAARLLILTSWACGVNAPFWTWWYRALNTHWQGGKVMGWVLASAALSPIWNGAFFCYTTSLTHAIKAQEGSLVVKLEERISTQLVPTVVKSCCLWIPFNFLNFTYISLDYRMLSGGLVALGWNVFLSIQANTRMGRGAASDDATPPARIATEDIALRCGAPCEK